MSKTLLQRAVYRKPYVIEGYKNLKHLIDSYSLKESNCTLNRAIKSTFGSNIFVTRSLLFRKSFCFFTFELQMFFLFCFVFCFNKNQTIYI